MTTAPAGSHPAGAFLCAEGDSVRMVSVQKGRGRVGERGGRMHAERSARENGLAGMYTKMVNIPGTLTGIHKPLLANDLRQV